MRAQGFSPSLSEHTSLLHRLFDRLIRQEMALELGTKSLYIPPSVWDEEEALLRIYYDRGGRLVTIGSDAHKAAQVGCGVREAQTLLRQIGFTHQTLFSRRQRRLQPL